MFNPKAKKLFEKDVANLVNDYVTRLVEKEKVWLIGLVPQGKEFEAMAEMTKQTISFFAERLKLVVDKDFPLRTASEGEQVPKCSECGGELTEIEAELVTDEELCAKCGYLKYKV